MGGRIVVRGVKLARLKNNWTLFFDNLTLFDFSPQIFLLVTSKMDRDGRNLHIARSFFHCYTMISSLAKVMGLQSTLLLEKTEDQKCEHTEYMILGFYKMHSS